MKVGIIILLGPLEVLLRHSQLPANSVVMIAAAGITAGCISSLEE
jgi:hypothetical protein